MDNAIPIGAGKLLDFIAEFEAPRGYGTIFANKQGLLPKPLTSMTLDEVLAHQPSWSRRFGSSAAGRYQFIRATLGGLKGELGLGGGEVFSPDLQDRLAFRLLERRGYASFAAGRLSLEGFALNLAKEWASLPVLRATQGAKRPVARGQSFYAGDGLNHALVSPERVEAVLREVHAAAGAQSRPSTRPENDHDTHWPTDAKGLPDMVPNSEPKPWYKSKAVIGGLIAAAVPIASIFFPAAATIDPASATGWLMRIVEVGGPVFGGLLAILGRVQADRPIAGLSGQKPETFLKPAGGAASGPGLSGQGGDVSLQLAETAAALRLVAEGLAAVSMADRPRPPAATIAETPAAAPEPITIPAQPPSLDGVAALARLVEIAPRLIEFVERSAGRPILGPEPMIPGNGAASGAAQKPGSGRKVASR